MLFGVDAHYNIDDNEYVDINRRQPIFGTYSPVRIS